MNNWKISIMLVLGVITLSFTLVYLFCDLERYENVEIFEEQKLDNSNIDVFVNKNFSSHNTSVRSDKITYIVIHYTGTESSAESIIKDYNHLRTIDASSDFFVDHNGDIYQYNPFLEERYTWAVGGQKKDTNGGSLYNVVTNENSISIELCTKNKGNDLNANSDGWYFSDETLNSSIELVTYLMKYYDISINNVVRHYDVTGKLCPGIVGWNSDSGSDEAWEEYLNKIE